MVRWLAPITLIFMLASCGSEPPQRVEDVRSSVRSVTNENGSLAITMISKGLDGGATDMAGFARDFFAVAKWQMVHGGGTNRITILAVVPTRDKYGNEGEQEAFILSVGGDDLGRIQWDNITHWDLMNLATFLPVHSFGGQLSRAWCSEEDNLRYSMRFCEQVRIN